MTKPLLHTRRPTVSMPCSSRSATWSATRACASTASTRPVEDTAGPASSDMHACAPDQPRQAKTGSHHETPKRRSYIFTGVDRFRYSYVRRRIRPFLRSAGPHDQHERIGASGGDLSPPRETHSNQSSGRIFRTRSLIRTEALVCSELPRSLFRVCWSPIDPRRGASLSTLHARHHHSRSHRKDGLTCFRISD